MAVLPTVMRRLIMSLLLILPFFSLSASAQTLCHERAIVSLVSVDENKKTMTVRVKESMCDSGSCDLGEYIIDQNTEASMRLAGGDLTAVDSQRMMQWRYFTADVFFSKGSNVVTAVARY